MSMLSKDDVLGAILKLHSQWRELLGDDGATAAQSLVMVAQGEGEDAHQAVNLLLELFEQHAALDVVRQQMGLESLSAGDSVRLYDLPPGQIGPVATTGIVYRCPVEPCHVTWRPQMAGQRIPHCPEHGQLLVPK